MLKIVTKPAFMLAFFYLGFYFVNSSFFGKLLLTLLVDD